MFFFATSSAMKEVISLSSRNKTLVSVILILTFAIFMANTIISPNNFAILPTTKIKLPENETATDDKYRRNNKGQKLTRADYRRQSQYHRKMLYR